jgi:hypothetical protein
MDKEMRDCAAGARRGEVYLFSFFEELSLIASANKHRNKNI